MPTTPTLVPVQKDDPGHVVVFDRRDFLHNIWQYRVGQHVTFLAPTQWGKTTLAFSLLQVSTYPGAPGVVLVMKPRDRVVSGWVQRLGYRTIREWPPPVHLTKYAKPPGYALWPKHTFDEDPDVDNRRLSTAFRRALTDCYRRGNYTLFADEVYGLVKELGLEAQLNTIWSRGASMGCGLWASSQRPYHVPQLAYGSAEHVFLGNDPDRRSRDRYSEIGGVDGDLVKELTAGLEKYQWLYIRRTGPAMCIVDA